MNAIKILFVSLVLTWTAAGNTQAAARSWQIDQAHSNFYFTVDHIFSKVRGFFPGYTGKVNFDPDNLADSSFAFTIQVASIDTNIAKRNEHLLTADFFDAAAFPEMTFVSKTITQTGTNTYDVAGTFTVKGVAHDLVLPLRLEGVKAHPMEKGKEVAGFNGTVTIDRLAYNVGDGKFYEMGVVGKDVEILVTLELLSDQ